MIWAALPAAGRARRRENMNDGRPQARDFSRWSGYERRLTALRGGSLPGCLRRLGERRLEQGTYRPTRELRRIGRPPIKRAR